MENNQEIIENAELNMMSSINHLETELAKIRAGKANPIMLKGVSVEYYGNMTPLNQVASISTPNAQTISIQPWEKDLLEEIEKSIINSNLGLNPVNNGESLLINIPPLTEERRMELTKLAKSESESAKVSIRNTRKDANNKIKVLDISDDLKSNLEIDSQELTDKYIKKVDEMFALKEKDILTLQHMDLIKIKDIYDSPNYNSQIIVAGWVRAFRGNRFIELNDGSTIENIQCVISDSNLSLIHI